MPNPSIEIGTNLANSFVFHSSVQALTRDGLQRKLEELQRALTIVARELAVFDISDDPAAILAREAAYLKEKFPWMEITPRGDGVDGGAIITGKDMRMMYQDYAGGHGGRLPNQGYFYTGMPCHDYSVEFKITSLSFKRLVKSDEVFQTPGMHVSSNFTMTHPHAHDSARVSGGFVFYQICNGANKFHPRLGGPALTSPMALSNSLNGLGVWLSTCNVSDTYDSPSLPLCTFIEHPKRTEWDAVREKVTELVPILNAALKNKEEIRVPLDRLALKSEVPELFSILLLEAGFYHSMRPQVALLFRDALVAWEIAYGLTFERVSVQGRNMKDQVLYDLATAPHWLRNPVAITVGSVPWDQQVLSPAALIVRYPQFNNAIATNL